MLDNLRKGDSVIIAWNAYYANVKPPETLPSGASTVTMVHTHYLEIVHDGVHYMMPKQYVMIVGLVPPSKTEQ